MQAISWKERVLQELEKIAFGDGPAAGRIKALEMLCKHIGLFTPHEVLEVERCLEKIAADIHTRLAVLFEYPSSFTVVFGFL